jgi:hypothetical protein
VRRPADIRALAPDGAELEKRIDAAIDNAAVFAKWPATVGVRGEPSEVVERVIYIEAAARVEEGSWP